MQLAAVLKHILYVVKLTGAQEQKLKCICWEIACRDYEYRYERFEKNRYKECSDYSDKCMVYKDLLEEIKKYNELFEVDDNLKDEILTKWRDAIQLLFEKSLMATCFKKQYEECKTLIACVKKQWIMSDKQLLTNKDQITLADRTSFCGLGLQEVFVKYVYAERNRCAHNTRSYQHNLPSLKSMKADDYKLQNYFLFMSLILLLDMIFVKLFEIYLAKVA